MPELPSTMLASAMATLPAGGCRSSFTIVPVPLPSPIDGAADGVREGDGEGLVGLEVDVALDVDADRLRGFAVGEGDLAREDRARDEIVRARIAGAARRADRIIGGDRAGGAGAARHGEGEGGGRAVVALA